MAICTISDFLKEILKFKSIIPNENIYYRGQNNGIGQGWELLPSFYRDKRKYSDVPFYKDKKEELNVIYKFVEKSYDYFKDVEFGNLISVINILQHYGFPTRALDVTKNPLVALYFALEKVVQGDGNCPVIYLIYAEKANAAFLINNDINLFYNEENPEKKRLSSAVLINGCNLSERIRSQKGDFIFFYEEVEIDKDPEFSIKEIPINVNNVKSLKDELDIIGISESTIYPSLVAETNRLRENLLGGYETKKHLEEKVRSTMTIKTSNTSDMVKRVLEEQESEIPRKYLENKKMFAGLKLKDK